MKVDWTTLQPYHWFSYIFIGLNHHWMFFFPQHIGVHLKATMKFITWLARALKSWKVGNPKIPKVEVSSSIRQHYVKPHAFDAFPWGSLAKNHMKSTDIFNSCGPKKGTSRAPFCRTEFWRWKIPCKTLEKLPTAKVNLRCGWVGLMVMTGVALPSFPILRASQK